MLQLVLVACINPASQWMALLLAGACFLMIVWWQSHARELALWRMENPDLWLSGVVFLGTIVYTRGYSTAAQPAFALTLLTGLVLGKTTSQWVRRRSDPARSESDLTTVLCLLVFILGIASLWPERGRNHSEYLGCLRWSGPWDNPNIFGLLMGVGVTLAAGQIFWGYWVLKRTGKAAGGDARRARGKWASGGCVILVMLLGRGLYYSFSRGAWLGTVCGAAYLFCTWLRLRKVGKFSDGLACGAKRRLRSNACWLIVILAATFTGCFWHLERTAWLAPHRAFSVANTQDFSWRNRVASWEGALQITTDNPWLGVGWNNAEPVYREYYLPPRLNDGAAIQTNNYLLLSSMVGLPALFCFGVYIWIMLSGRGGSGPRRYDKGETVILTTACRAAAIVMLIGFWFDGGLFELATATLFWVLLELGSVWHPGVGRRTPENISRKGAGIGLAGVLCLIFRPVDGRGGSLVFSGWGVGFLAGVLLFLGALFWASAQDRSVTKWLTFETAEHDSFQCVTVRPKATRPCPVVVYARDSAGGLMSNGKDVRQMPEFGLAVVCLEYNRKSAGVFSNKMDVVLKYLESQSWADTHAMAWVGFGDCANQMLSYAVQYPDSQPRLIIQLNSSGFADFILDRMARKAGIESPVVSAGFDSAKWGHLHCPLVFVHGDRDEVSALDKTRQFVAVLQANGVSAVRSLCFSDSYQTPGAWPSKASTLKPPLVVVATITVVPSTDAVAAPVWMLPPPLPWGA